MLFCLAWALLVCVGGCKTPAKDGADGQPPAKAGPADGGEAAGQVPKTDDARSALVAFLDAYMRHDNVTAAKYLAGDAAAKFRPEEAGKGVSFSGYDIGGSKEGAEGEVSYSVTLTYSTEDGMMVEKPFSYRVARVGGEWKVTERPEEP